MFVNYVKHEVEVELDTLTEVFLCFSSVVRQIPG
jgi:hypothetical protein